MNALRTALGSLLLLIATTPLMAQGTYTQIDVPGLAQGSTESVLYNFVPATGYLPSGVIRDAAGNFYAGTGNGVTNRQCNRGCGAVLELSPGQPKVLYAFGYSGFSQGGPFPNTPIMDRKGNLYVATRFGGAEHSYGGVFKLTASGQGGFLYSFQGGQDGATPVSGLTMDSASNLYGTTYIGGTGCSQYPGCGTVYKVTPSGVETVLYRFSGGTDGAFPLAAPILDSAGNLYGTTAQGGDLTCALGQGLGCGTVWKLDTSGNLTVLYCFTGGTDGGFPEAALLSDSNGNLFGVAGVGGDLSCNGGYGCGVVFEIDSSGNFTVLHSFIGGSADGMAPLAALLRDTRGNLYGTTASGGDQACGGSGLGCGVVFKLDPFGKETILHAFTGGTTDGEEPLSPLIPDGKGNLYGTTLYGGVANGGVLFEVKLQ